jgi:hypothetical protein
LGFNGNLTLTKLGLTIPVLFFYPGLIHYIYTTIEDMDIPFLVKLERTYLAYKTLVGA